MWEIGFIAIGLAIAVVCAYALYRAAARDGRNPFVWGAVGLLTTVIGVLVYRLSVGPIVQH